MVYEIAISSHQFTPVHPNCYVVIRWFIPVQPFTGIAIPTLLTVHPSSVSARVGPTADGRQVRALLQRFQNLSATSVTVAAGEDGFSYGKMVVHSGL